MLRLKLLDAHRDQTLDLPHLSASSPPSKYPLETLPPAWEHLQFAIDGTSALSWDKLPRSLRSFHCTGMMRLTEQLMSSLPPDITDMTLDMAVQAQMESKAMERLRSSECRRISAHVSPFLMRSYPSLWQYTMKRMQSKTPHLESMAQFRCWTSRNLASPPFAHLKYLNINARQVGATLIGRLGQQRGFRERFRGSWFSPPSPTTEH